MNERRNPNLTEDRNPNLAADIDSTESRTPVLDATEKRMESERERQSSGAPASMPPTATGHDGLSADPRTTETAGGKGGLQTDPVMKAQTTGTAESRPAGGDSSNAASHEGGASSLLPTDKADSFGRRWTDIQSNFVDEPKTAVRNADGLVSEVIQELSSRFAQEREGFEHQWSGGGDVSTEDLRMALRHYRDFFQRLLAA
jgi:hypothetical protein